MNPELVREVAIEIAELKTEFDSRINALHRKLKIALGDVTPMPTVTEFRGRDGVCRPIKKRAKK